jgi:hypothetical protein
MMPELEIDLAVLTPLVDELDRTVQRMIQHAVEAVLEERGPDWLNDSWLAAVTGVFSGLSRAVGIMPPESQAVFWRAVQERVDAIKAMQSHIWKTRLDGTLIPRDDSGVSQ